MGRPNQINHIFIDKRLYEFDIALEKLKSIQAGSILLYCEIHKLINSVWNKEELPQQ
jgi:hypothetical protein